MTGARWLVCLAAAVAGGAGLTGVAVGSAGAAVASPRREGTPARLLVRAHREGAPARMLVYAQEWSLWPSRATLPAGRVVVQLWNRGQDAHDLRIRRVRRGRLVGRAQGIRVTPSGAVDERTWTLGPGRYELYCSLPGHRHRGMQVRITVG